jgi:hypothetical protein
LRRSPANASDSSAGADHPHLGDRAHARGEVLELSDDRVILIDMPAGCPMGHGFLGARRDGEVHLFVRKQEDTMREAIVRDGSGATS